jgi:hypothetical protein
MILQKKLTNVPFKNTARKSFVSWCLGFPWDLGAGVIGIDL